MAGDWIKWSKGLTRKMEVMQIAARLHIAPAHAAGTLMQLMEWLDENVSSFDSDGNAFVTLGPLQSSALDVTLGVSGFIEAMAEVGWAKLENDRLIFVHAERHNGKTAKARALTKNRVEKNRNNFVTLSPLQKRYQRREEKSNIIQTGNAADAAVIPFPPELDTPEFRAAWSDWLAYRRERKLTTYKPKSLSGQFSTLAGWGVDAAITSIRESIRQHWQGLFEPKVATGGPRQTQKPETQWAMQQRSEAIRQRMRDLSEGHEGQKYVGMRPGETSPYEWTAEGRAEYDRLRGELADLKNRMTTAA